MPDSDNSKTGKLGSKKSGASGELYDSAVGDGSAPEPSPAANNDDRPDVVGSNSSNYGGSAIAGENGAATD